MDLCWSEETFAVPHVIENVEFPQLLKLALTPQIRCNETVSHLQNTNGCTSKSTHTLLSDGDVLKLHGIRSFKKVILTGAGATLQTDSEQVANEYGYLSPPGSTSIYRQFSVPVSYSMPFQILPFRDLRHVYATAGDLVKEQPRPSAVIVNKTISLPEKHCVIKEGDVLAITSVDKRCTSAGVVDFLICKHNDKTIGLPMACAGNFTALQDETLLSLQDLVSKHIDIGLPQKICFNPVSSSDSLSQFQTLVRGGEHHIIPGSEYIAENIVKQQYMICTKCEDKNGSSLSQTRVYYIPTNCLAARNMKVRLPLFHDIKTCQQVLHNRYCSNLSMRDILDATPIEQVGEPEITVRRLSEVYDANGPQLPPRKEGQPPETVSLRSAASSHRLDQRDVGKSSNYANVQVFHARMNSSDSNLSGLENSFGAASVGGGSRMLQSPSLSEQMYSPEEQPLLEDGDANASSKDLRSCGHTKISVTQRRGTSTPCTPESRRKKGNAPTWTEKISISLENLKKTFRKAGSEERERTKLGDGSHLADSFENLATCSSSDSSQVLSPHSANYQNIKLVASQSSKTSGRSRAGPQQPLSSIHPSKCSQIRELWTPPCSPDYRDHTTPHIEPHHAGFSHSQFGNPAANHATSARLNTDFPFTQFDGASNAFPTPAVEPNMSFNMSSTDQPRFTKSPKATPRQARDIPIASNGLYENIEKMSSPENRCAADDDIGTTPLGRCSGYSSSGSRGSSENDLIHYQLETIKSVDMIPEDLRTLSVPGLCDCLHLFELPNVAHKFRQNQIDGQFFMIMTEHMFRDDAFNFSEFELLKLRQLRDGWRPRL